MNRRISLILVFLLTLSSCEKLLYEDIPPTGPIAVFDRLWNEFQMMYGPFEDRGVDWNALRSKYRSRLTDRSDDELLFKVLSDMLAELNDSHVNLFSPDRPLFQSYAVFREKRGDDLFDLDLLKKNYLAAGYTDTESYTYGLTHSNCLYLRLAHIDDQTPVLEKLIDRYPDVSGLIIDLRHSPGGDFTWSFPSLGRLTDRKRLVFRSRTRNGPEPGSFTPWYEWYLEPSGKHQDKPVVVLVDRYTNSASERTVMALNVLPQVTIIGDTTAGGHSTNIGRELQNGWHFSLPTQQTRFADGKSYEGKGIAPDIIEINTRAGLDKGRDEVMEKALSLLR